MLTFKWFLLLGDPTIFGNLKPHDAIIDAIQNAVTSMRFNGYAPTVGYAEAREAVAEYYSTEAAPVSPNVSRAYAMSKD